MPAILGSTDGNRALHDRCTGKEKAAPGLCQDTPEAPGFSRGVAHYGSLSSLPP